MKTFLCRTWKVGRLLLLAYGIVLALLFAFQRTLMYPGRASQGDPAAVVNPRSGLEILQLGQSRAAFLPADEPEAPTLLMFYGNGDALKSFLPWAEGMRQRGFNVAVLEYPGYGMSGGNMTEANAFAAADLLYTIVASRAGVNPEKIIAFGVSLGGGVAVHVAANHPVAGVATFSTFTSMRSMAVRTVKIIPPMLVLDDYDNLTRLRGMTVPVYLVHGTADEIVPFEMSRTLRDAAGGEVTYVPVEGASHNDLFEVGGPPMWDALADWCERVAG